MKENKYAIIMAGGIGSRFWPMSRTQHPKQFIDILGAGKTLIQQTFDRLSKVCPIQNIYIVTNDIYKDTVLEQLSISSEQVLCEPARRNTAPCIAYAAFKIHQKNPDALMVVAPSDHLILQEDEFVKCIEIALEAANQNDALITLGIQPSRPDTGYGYIQYTEETIETNQAINKVKTFTEKPDLELAKQFIESGDFLWNAGIFVWSSASIIKSFQKDLKDIYDPFMVAKHLLNSPEEEVFINKTYPTLPNISIDFGIMEKAENVYVLPTDFGWSDLGTFGSIYNHLEKDDNLNATLSDNVLTYNSSNNIIHSDSKKLIVVDGLDDYIVVDKDNVLLICKKENEQNIKQYMNDAKRLKGEEYV